MHDQPVFVALVRIELHLPEARSLKEKRSHVRRLTERLRSRHQVLVVEADHQQLHQRTALAICAISTNASELEERMERVTVTIEQLWEGFVLDRELSIVET
jgi:hypothetical protein